MIPLLFFCVGLARLVQSIPIDKYAPLLDLKINHLFEFSAASDILVPR
jgi:hypothetical protein